MILRISDEFDTSFNTEVYSLSSDMLSMKSTHMFIASHAWERIELSVTDTIPTGYLGSMNLVCKDIKVKLPEKVTDKTLLLLTELYPEKAGKLRRCYMAGSPIREVLGECLIA